MASDSEASYRQRAIVAFVQTEGGTVGNMLKRLKNVCGECTVDRRAVGRWAKRVNS